MMPLDEPFPIEEITPLDVWEKMGVQVYHAREPLSLYTSTFLVYDGQAWLLETGFAGEGVQPEDLVAADLDSDGVSELAYVFSYGHEIEQATHLGVFQADDDPPGLLALDFTYLGDIGLQLSENDMVQAGGNPYGSQEHALLGYLVLQGKVLNLTANPGQVEKLSSYLSERFGISFQYPATWEQVGQDHFQGETGFFEITPYASVASGLSDVFDGISLRMIRACTWELNAQPGKYGSTPGAGMMYDVPGMARCQIIPSEDAPDVQPSLLLETPDGGFALLQADSAQLDLIHQTVETHYSPGDSQPIGLRAFAGEGLAPDLALETQQLGDLTLEEYRLFPDTVHTPDEAYLAEALAGVRQKRAAWREVDDPLYGEERLVHDNRTLEMFGYRLEGYTDSKGEFFERLYQGETLLKENLQFWVTPMALNQDAASVHNFAALFEERRPDVTRAWLLTKEGLQPWVIDVHLYDAPIFVGDQLASYEHARADGSPRLSVTLDGQPVYTLLLPWSEPLSVHLDQWDDTWVLEVDGTLVVNGAIANLARGYGEIFSYHQLAEKPFFFFEKDRQVGLFYDGAELPVRYDEIIHAQCCGGQSNPHHSPNMLSFYARRDGIWYYVEIGKYS
jgi:hypothetical protein